MTDKPTQAMGDATKWKLVPVDPTVSMWVDGFEAVSAFHDTGEYHEMAGCKRAAESAKICWKAMIDAAPTAPTADATGIESIIARPGERVSMTWEQYKALVVRAGRPSEAAEPVAWMRTYRQFNDTQSEAPDPGYMVTSFHQNAEFAAKFPDENTPLCAYPDLTPVGVLDPCDALRYQLCRESAVERGLFETPEEYDAMVDASLQKKGKEPLTGRGHNYGKKVSKDGSLYRPSAPQPAPPSQPVYDTSVVKRIATQMGWTPPVEQPSEAQTAERAMTDAARDVLAERERQVTQEGWVPAHDDQYVDGELAHAAACYASVNQHWYATPGNPPPQWPWHANWWKPIAYRRNLVKAAALILADIERYDRALLEQKP